MIIAPRLAALLMASAVLFWVHWAHADGHVRLRLPISVQNSHDGSQLRLQFELMHSDVATEAVARFCYHHRIAPPFCSLLMSRVEDQLMDDAGVDSTFFVGNNNAVRLTDAFFNEVSTFREDKITAPSVNVPEEAKRIVVIHSCTFMEQQQDVLGDMLYRIEQSGLLGSVDGVWILNYGVERAIPLCTSNPGNISACIHHANAVHMVQVATDCSNFEAPTVKFISDLSRVLSNDAQILYMHNKGVSYAEIPQSITDYRNMMIYFLVEKHYACFHLLQSGVLDVLGINFRGNAKQGHFFSGNFWWATAEYISNIPHFSFSHKYSAERFILSHPSPRVYVMYESGSDDISVLHPRESYIEDAENKNKRKKCINVNQFCL